MILLLRQLLVARRTTQCKVELIYIDIFHLQIPMRTYSKFEDIQQIEDLLQIDDIHNTILRYTTELLQNSQDQF